MPDPKNLPPKKRDVEEEDFQIEATEDQQIKQNHLIVISIDHYVDKDIPDLSNCVRDGEALIDVLTDGYFFNKENIYYLRSKYREEEISPKDLKKIAQQEKAEKGYAYVGEATHNNMINQLRELAKDSQKKLKEAKKKNKHAVPESNYIICYSGHGIYDEVFNEGYWVPSDGIKHDHSTYIENSTIVTILKSIKSHHTVLISDSCYSGSLFSVGGQRNMSVPRVYKYPSRWAITAGRKNQTVSDGNLGGNSPFAEKMLEIFRLKQEVWIGDLGRRITEAVGEGEKQQPMYEALSNIDGHDGGQYVFLPRLATEIDYWRITWRENTRKAYYAFLSRYPDGEFEKEALLALNIFAEDKKPLFTEEALKSFAFLEEEGLHPIAKEYHQAYMKGETPFTLTKEPEQKKIYEWLKKKAFHKKIATKFIREVALHKGDTPLYLNARSTFRSQPRQSSTKFGKEFSWYTIQQEAFMAFAPDGDSFLTRSLLDHKIRLWDIASGEVIRELKDSEKIGRFVVFSPDGSKMLTPNHANDIVLYAWGKKLKEINTFKGHSEPILSASFAPNGKYFVTGSNDKTVKVWEKENQNIYHYSYEYDYGILSVEVNRDNEHILVLEGNPGMGIGSQFNAKVWKLGTVPTHILLKGYASYHPQRGHRKRLHTAKFSSDGKYILTSSLDHQAKLWNLNGDALRTYHKDKRPREVESNVIRTAIFSPDDQYILTTGEVPRIWDRESEALIHGLTEGNIDFRGKSTDTYSSFACFSPKGGKYILTGSRTKDKREIYELKLWLNPLL